jgi:hypothetical protein
MYAYPDSIDFGKQLLPILSPSGLGGASSYGAHPTLPMATGTGQDPTWPDSASYPPGFRDWFRKMRLKAGTSGRSTGEREAFIQWGSLALRIMPK